MKRGGAQVDGVAISQCLKPWLAMVKGRPRKLGQRGSPQRCGFRPARDLKPVAYSETRTLGQRQLLRGMESRWRRSRDRSWNVSQIKKEASPFVCQCGFHL